MVTVKDEMVGVALRLSMSFEQVVTLEKLSHFLWHQN